MRQVRVGQTDYTVVVKILGTDGAPETGLAHTDIDLAYWRVEIDNDVTTTDVSPASLSALTDAHTDWGWEEISSTDHPGLYRLDIADAVFATGAWEAGVTITDASGTDFYPHDVGFRLETAAPLPDATPGTQGGLFIAGANVANITVTPTTGDALVLTGADTSDEAATAGMALRLVPGNSNSMGTGTGGDGLRVTAGSGPTSGAAIRGNVTGNITGNLSGSVGSVGTVSALGTNAITSGSIAANAIGASEIADGALTVAKFATVVPANITQVAGQTASASDTVDFDDLGGSSTGTGARTVTATVDDGSTALSSAVIRFTKGAETYSTTTNGSGQAVFNLDDGTWTVAISKSGYTFAGDTLVVNGDETATYSMTAVTIAPASDPAQTTGYLTTRNGAGAAKGNVTVAFRLIEGPGDAGHSYDRKPFTATSNGSGLLEVTLLREATYAAIRGDGNQTQFTTEDASTYQLPENIGYDD